MKGWNLFKTILWWIFGGLPVAIEYVLFGCILCISVVGIPLGLQAFKLAQVSLFPFNNQITKPNKDILRGTLGCLGNIIWILFFGWEIAFTHLIFGLLLMCTIIGIPWGIMHFNMIKISFTPFGRKVTLKME